MSKMCAVACALAAACLPGTAQAAGSVLAGSEIWNAPLPADPQLEAGSAARVADLVAQIRLQAAVGSRPNISTVRSSTPVYRVTSSTPKQPLYLDGGGAKNARLQALIDAHGGVPFPPGEQPDNGRDGEITVLDTDSRTLYEFYRASSPQQNDLACTFLPWHSLLRPAFCHRDYRWHAVTGGIMQHYDTDVGVFSRSSWPGLEPDEGWNWGASATSLPLAAGLITFEDLASGVIDHAISGLVRSACQDDHMYPAQRDDGIRRGLTCMPEGARLQLDPAYDVEANSHPPLTKMIERAAQKYGIIITDVTHQTFSLKAQNPQTEPYNRYLRGPGIGGVPNGDQGYFGGQSSPDLLRGFPWELLRVVDEPHCYNPPHGPCPP